MLKQLAESFFFLGEQEPQFDRDDAISNASLSLYIIFISEAHCFEDKEKKGAGIFLSFFFPSLVSLTFSFFFIAVRFHIKSLLSKIELQSPGERMLK